MNERPRSYAVSYDPRAMKELAKLDKRAARRVVHAVDALSADPRRGGVRRLVGHADLWRIRVGDYRVIYTIRDAELVVLDAPRDPPQPCVPQHVTGTTSWYTRGLLIDDLRWPAVVAVVRSARGGRCGSVLSGGVWGPSAGRDRGKRRGSGDGGRVYRGARTA